MRRITALVILVLFLCSCAAKDEKEIKGFYCTQETVCKTLPKTAKYDLFRCGTDTGLTIPGLRQNFVPQGIACWEQRNWILLSGYFLPYSGGPAAALLAVDIPSGKLVGEYSLLDEQGRDCAGHFSGVAVAENHLYVTGKNSLYQVKLSEFDRAGGKGAVRVSREIPVALSPGSCGYANGILWVCEYFQDTNYTLADDHAIRCEDGQVQHAWMIGYQTDRQGDLQPYCVFSVPDRIQGVTALEDGRFIMSQSYGRRNVSSLLVLRDPREHQPPASYVELGGKTVPMWQLDSSEVLDELSMPPMAEGCCAVGNQVLLIFESCAYYYRALNPERTALDPTDKIWMICIPEKN